VNDEIFSDFEIEKAARSGFGKKLEIKHVILREVPVGPTANATLFLTEKDALFLYVTGQAPLLLMDVQKIVQRMKLVAREYLPPAGSPEYFEFVGKQKFHEVFPSRTVVNDSDLAYYKTLAPYNPGLVRIGHVKNGEVYGYDIDTRDWRKAAEYKYNSIKAN